MWARLRERLTDARIMSVRHGKLGILSWHVGTAVDAREQSRRLRAERARYHLGRARRARDAGHPEAGAHEARRALSLAPSNPWALAVLGQCLLRQPSPDLAAARRVTEQAWALDPTNGYFVRLLLDVLDEQGDTAARADLLDWAWWKGAPVERWLPDGVTPLSADDRADVNRNGSPVPASQHATPRHTDAPVAVPA